ncbi:MAG: hypothetical protein QJT81_13135 [Candidatus Thiothrix putei]|uniref:Neprosin activation peptide domain-containing protein n=1 Tax=Candidatus Thiothrix putei TaxID=3080811 RepID=A0AA95HCU1_9GAMM|nr:MAG: hypothetical protein QJT81_13135 [Candidatus Thiothrix putei]
MINKVYLSVLVGLSLAIPNITIANPPSKKVHSPEQIEKFKKYIDDLYDKKDIVDTFQNSAGQIIDCVKIEGQPSLKGKGLKNKDIPRQPTIVPLDLNPSVNSSDPMFSDIPSDDRGCPVDSVPIVRLSLDVLTNFDDIASFHRKYPKGKKDILSGDVSAPATAAA